MNDNQLIVIGHYWHQRERDLTRIVEALIPHYRVMVWDNDPDHTWTHDGVSIVYAPHNAIHGRYLAALLCPTVEYFLFQDDDMMLSINTIELLFDAAEQSQYTFYGIEGRMLMKNHSRPYSYAIGVRAPESCDMLIRAYTGHRHAVQYGLNWILETGIAPGRSETILMTYGRSVLVPGTDWTTLDEHGVGLCYDPKHDAEIDDFYNRYLRNH